MHPFRRPLAMAVAVALLIAPAVAQQPEKSGSTPSSSMPGTADSQNGTPGTSSPADHAMMAGMTKMNQAIERRADDR